MSTSAMSFETHQSPWWLHLLGGIFNIIIGILLFTSPAMTVVALVFGLGFFWLFEGIFTLTSLFIDRSAWGWKLFIGVISVMAGLTLIRHPLAGALAVPAIIILIMGIQGLVSGIGLLVLAFKGGGLGSAVVGVLSLVFGGILVMNYANLNAIVSLVWVLAAFALAGGLIQVFQAFRQRSD